MKIPVIDNPFKSRNGARRKNMARKRKASPAQLAARKKFAAAARSGKFRKAKASRPARKRRASRRRKALSVGKHRPVVIRKKSGKLYRPRRSSLPSHARFENPFLGGLITMGNPHRKRRKASRKGRRHSRRSSSRSIFANPLGGSAAAVLSGPREMMKKDFVTEAASVAVGFVLPGIVMTYLPVSMRNTPWKGYLSKVAVVAVLSGASSMVSKRVARAVLLGGGVSILLDLYTDYVHPMIAGIGSPAAPAPANGTGVFWGNPGDAGAGMGAFYGGPSDPGGMGGLGDGAGIGEAFA